MKKGILFFLLFGLHQLTFAQFQFDIGGGFAKSDTRVQNFVRPYVYPSGWVENEYYSYSIHATGYGMYVYPKYHFMEWRGMTLSIGTPFMFGLSGSNSSLEGTTLSYIMDANVAIDLNAGRLNRRQANPDKMFGFFVGAGIGVLNTDGITYSGGRNYNINDKVFDLIAVPENAYISDYMRTRSSAMYLHTGLVAPFLFRKQSSKNMGFRAFVKPAFKATTLTYWGMSLFYTLGK